MYDQIDWLRTQTARLEEHIHTKVGREPKLLPDFPVFKQFDNWTCGVHCIYAILRWYGRHTHFETLRVTLRSSEARGTQERNMRRVLRLRGFRSNTLTTLHQIYREINEQRPIVALVDDEEHWLVVYGYDDDGVYVSDSSSSKVRITEKRFRKRWDGHAFSVASRIAR